ncbi:MAG: DUF3243 domain-containing protein [Clostridia bacterium]|nr:DUF3243 domain-containing protein [Bacillota bacterium]MBO2522036.1 DUF3243 domain-containing protein [Bacillota bacterium]
MQQVAGSWEAWKSQLAQAVQLGQSMNLSQEELAKRAEQVGDFLASKIDPKNPEQKVLKELWEAADDEEQRTIANVLIKLVSGTKVH